jgi:DNA-binding MarR family transcriptional regulator
MNDVKEPSLVELIEAVWRRVKAELADDPIPEAPDLRPSQLRVLARTPLDGIRGTDLAARTQMTAQALGTIVDVLEHAGYLERVPDTLDRRAKLIQPTAKGRIVHRKAHRKLEQLEQCWRAEIGDHHWRQLRSTLRTLAHPS